MPELSPFTRARLERIAERALREAGVAGRLPTPLEEVQRAAGIGARRDIAELPRAIATPDRRLLGALWFERREVYVDLAQPEPRRRFTDAHEAIHALCPWHEAVLREDTEDELFRETALAVEAEANYGAGPRCTSSRSTTRRRSRCSRSAASHSATAACRSGARSHRRRSGAASGGSAPTSRPAARCASWSRPRAASRRPPPRGCRWRTAPGESAAGPRRRTTTGARSSSSSPGSGWRPPYGGTSVVSIGHEEHEATNQPAPLGTERLDPVVRLGRRRARPVSAARRAAPCPTRSAAARRRARTPSAP